MPSATLLSISLQPGGIIAWIVVGLLAGYFRGVVDAVFSRAMDILWAFPVVILGVALGTALNLGGLKIGPISIQPVWGRAS